MFLIKSGSGITFSSSVKEILNFVFQTNFQHLKNLLVSIFPPLLGSLCYLYPLTNITINYVPVPITYYRPEIRNYFAFSLLSTKYIRPPPRICFSSFLFPTNTISTNRHPITRNAYQLCIPVSLIAALLIGHSFRPS